MLTHACHTGRPDGNDLFFVTPKFLHIFDFSMSMLPFAIKTDMVTALKTADCALKEHTDFMASLLEEHELPKARTQLIELWGKWIDTRYGGQAASTSKPSIARSGARIMTPPSSPDGSAAGEGGDLGSGAGN
jgi:hypothetical protein